MKNIFFVLVFGCVCLSAKQESRPSGLVDSVNSMLANPRPYDPLFLAPAAFVLGMVSSLTPCIYPMIPVTANIFRATGQASFLRTILGALAYFMGVTTVYSGAGFLAARTGAFFGNWFSSPWFLILAMIFFLIMSMNSLGMINSYFDFGYSSLGQSYFVQGRQMALWKKYLLGSAVGLTASPCITPALAMLLSFAGKTNMPFFGFLLLFSYAFGFCFILLLSSILFSKAILLRPGRWMDYFKTFLALLVAFYGFWFIQPIVGTLIVVAMFLIYCALALMAL